MDITLNDDLKILPLRSESAIDFIDRHTDKSVDYSTRKVTQSLFPLGDDIANEVYHNNYLEYLELCWGSHYGVVFTPDVLWYTLLSEISLTIREDVEGVRGLFTDSPEKKEVTVLCYDYSDITLPLDRIAGELRKFIPGGFADTFIADFSTTDDRAKLAAYAAFADAVSPYYSYSMKCCGIPRVRVLGSREDYSDIRSRWTAIGDMLQRHQQYFAKVAATLTRIVGLFDDTDTEFVKNIFVGERCGSGSQVEVSGWFADLFRVRPERPCFLHNFSTHIAKVDYKNITTNREFQLQAGVFSSKAGDGFLQPQFGQMIYEKREQEVRDYAPQYRVETFG
jgi:hypothetical protein